MGNERFHNVSYNVRVGSSSFLEVGNSIVAYNRSRLMRLSKGGTG